MAETSLYPGALDSTNLYEVVARLSTTLTADITAATTTIPLASTTGFPTQGYIVIDNETIAYISVSVSSVDATGGRGHAGTAASHLNTTQVLVAVTAAVFNKLRAGLIAVQTKVGINSSVDTTTLDYATKSGWISTGTFTYNAANKITVASGAPSIYNKSDKLMFTQNGVVKTFYVIAVDLALLWVTAGTDYTVENTATYPITLPYYSHIENPLSFKQWFPWTPAITYAGGTTDPTSNTVNMARFKLAGNMVSFYLKSTLVRGSGNRTTTFFSLPIARLDATLVVLDSVATITGSAVYSGYSDSLTVMAVIQTMSADGVYWIKGSYEI